MKNIFIIIAFILSSSLSAQIHIEANTSVSGQKFIIDIDDTALTYFLTLKIRDSISTSKKYEDEMNRYREKYFSLKDQSIKSDSVKMLIEQMKIFTEKNSYYSTIKTEISKTEYPVFDTLINLFKTGSIDFFEKNEQNKDRIVLDGTGVTITVNNKGKIKTIWAHSPRENSHPEISSLLTSTLEVLRNKKLLSADKRITSGY